MNESFDPLETLWDNLLSRQVEQIQQAYIALSEEEQAVVRTHLQRMASEPGWHPEQVRSAQTALQAIESLPAQDSH